MLDSTVTLSGNLTRQPELRFTQDGQAVVSFGLAVNRRYQRDGEWVERASFFECRAWGQLAENVAGSLAKGQRAVVFGRLEQREYETREGEKRSVVEVVATDCAPSLKWASAVVERNERRQPARSPSTAAFADEEPF